MTIQDKSQENLTGKRTEMTEEECDDIGKMMEKKFNPAKFDSYLLRHNLDINAKVHILSRDISIMAWAVENMNTAAVDHLLSRGADINERDNSGRTRLHDVSIRLNSHILDSTDGSRTEKRRKFDCDMIGKVSEFRKFLISRGAAENVVDNYGKTPVDYLKPKDEPNNPKLKRFDAEKGMPKRPLRLY